MMATIYAVAICGGLASGHPRECQVVAEQDASWLPDPRTYCLKLAKQGYSGNDTVAKYECVTKQVWVPTVEEVK